MWSDVDRVRVAIDTIATNALGIDLTEDMPPAQTVALADALHTAATTPAPTVG